jgi:NADH-quinone oxidoreductase subunit K
MYAPDYAIYIFLTLYFLAFVIFFTGLFAIVFAKRSLVLVLLGLELLLLGVSLLCLLSAKVTGTLTGQLALLLFLVLGGTESGIGLALVMLYFYQKGTILLKNISDLKY